MSATCFPYCVGLSALVCASWAEQKVGCDFRPLTLKCGSLKHLFSFLMAQSSYLSREISQPSVLASNSAY